MTDMYKPINDNGPNPSHNDNNNNLPPSSREASRTLLAGVVGGIVSAAAYLIYSRLPDDQRDRLHSQARTLIESKVNEMRSRFNI
jgi:hypothetical protein